MTGQQTTQRGGHDTGLPTLRVLVWHVHGSWMDAFVRGGHEYLVPRLPDGGDWGRGRCGRDWPENAREVDPRQLADLPVDVVVAQRPGELDLAARWLGRRPGRDIPVVYVEHNTPGGHAPSTRHPLADRDDLTIVHVTHFNALMWDCGRTPTRVIDHGVVDPGYRYTGALDRAATMINDPVRRGRAVGTDLLPHLARGAPIDVYGIAVDRLRTDPSMPPTVVPRGDLRTDELHDRVAERRVYVHTARWTSLGLSLIEAMLLGMPVLALGTTEAPVAVPGNAGRVATDIDELTTELRALVHDPDRARELGRAARAHALDRFGLARFTRDWDMTLIEAMRAPAQRSGTQRSGIPSAASPLTGDVGRVAALLGGTRT